VYLDLARSGLDEIRISLDAADPGLGRALTLRKGAFRACVRTLRALMIGTAIGTGALTGIGFWAPTFYERHTTLTSSQASGVVASPMQGTVLAVTVAEGDSVRAGQVLCIVEAMKMENEVTAHWAGTVTEISVAPGTPVTTGQRICVIEAGPHDLPENR